MPVIRTGFVLGIAGPAITALGCSVELRRARLPRARALRRGAGDRAALARGRGRDVPARAPRARDVVRALRRRLGRRSSGRSSSGRSSPGRALTPHELVVPWLAAGRSSPLAGLSSRSACGPTRRSSPRRSRRRSRRERAAGAARARSCAGPASRRRWSRAVGELRGDGRRDEPRRLRRRRPPTTRTATSSRSSALHIVGMYGLVLVVGDLIDRIGRTHVDGDRAAA